MSSPRRYRWLQFSLRTVLTLTAMVACFLGGWKAREQSPYISVSTHEPRRGMKIEAVVLEVNDKKNLLRVLRWPRRWCKGRYGISSCLVENWKLAEVKIVKTSPDRCVGVIKSLYPPPRRMFWDCHGRTLFEKGITAVGMPPGYVLISEFLAEQPGAIGCLTFECYARMIEGIDELRSLVGQELGVSDWLEVSQADDRRLCRADAATGSGFMSIRSGRKPNRLMARPWRTAF